MSLKKREKNISEKKRFLKTYFEIIHTKSTERKLTNIWFFKIKRILNTDNML